MNVLGSVFVGTRVLITGRFHPAANMTLTDPVNVAVKARKPDGTLVPYVFGTAPELTRTGDGVYEFRLLLTERGRWWFGVEGYGMNSLVQTVEEVSVIVKQRTTV